MTKPNILTLFLTCLILAVPMFGITNARQEEGSNEREDDGLSERWKWFFLQRTYPKDTMPDGARMRAIRQRDQMPEYRRLSLRAGPGSSWTFLGPSGFDSTVAPTWGRMSGRTRALVIDPGNSARMFVGTATGGVWRTTNGGSSWTPLTDTQDSLSIGSLAMDPQNSNTIYAGTGEGPAGAYYSVGILKSTNGGDTWTKLSEDTFARQAIAELLVSPTSSDTVLACATSGSHQPGGSIQADFNKTGIFRSTDGAASFTQIQDGFCQDLVADPSNFNNQYASMVFVGDEFGGPQDGLYKSTDGGMTWTQLGGGAPTSVARINIGISADGMTLYAGGKDSAQQGATTRIWKSTDAGATWTVLGGAPDYCAGQCFYDNDVAVSPANANHAYFGGVAFFRTLDGGTSFNRLGADNTSQPQGSLHVDHHILVFDPNDANTLYDGNDGGLYRSTNINTPGDIANPGPTWTSLTGNTLGSLQFYDLVLHPSDPNIMLGGLQDNGTEVRTSAGGNVWTERCGGDGGYSMIDHANPAIMYCSFANGSEMDGVGISKSTDGGISFQGDASLTAQGERTGFIVPVIMDPVASTTLYVGTQRLWRSTDGGANWTALGPADLTGGMGKISHLEVAPSNTQVIWMVTDDGKVQRTTDGGATFTDTTKAPLPGRFATEVSVHPTDPNTAYVGFSGFDDNTPASPGHIFRTADGGASWTNVTNNLPDIPVNTVEIRPDRPTEIYAGTDVGMFISQDSGATWAKMTGGIPNAGVIRIKAHRGTDRLVVATHGRGVWSTGLSEGAAASLQFAQFGNGAGLKSEIVLTNPSSSQAATGEVTLFDTDGNVLDLRANLSATAGVDLSGVMPSFNISPLGSVRISTDGLGDLSQGSVAVNSSSTLGGVTRFEIAGIGVAGVGAGEPFKSAIAPVQRVGSIRTGIASRNGSASQQAEVSMVLRDLGGNPVGESVEVTLGPNSRNSQFIDEIFPGATPGFQGTVKLQSANSITSLALELGSPGQFTTLPVNPVASGPAADSPSLRGGAPTFQLNFAQFGNGMGLTSEIVVTTAQAASGTIFLFDASGQVQDLSSNLMASGPIDTSQPEIGFNLPADGSLRVKTDGQGSLVQGSALVLSDVPMGGVIRFEIADIGVAGVGAARAVNRAIAPVQRVGAINTGLAIRNVSFQDTATVTLTLRDLQGNAVANGVTMLQLGPDSRESKFLSELFPEAQTVGFQGTVTIESSIPVATIALELGAAGQFTTLPVTELAASP